MKKEYIRDNGKIRNCSSNVAKMGFFRYIIFDIVDKNFFGYVFKELGREVIETSYSIFQLLINILFVICFPVTLALRSIYYRKRSKKDIKNCN